MTLKKDSAREVVLGSGTKLTGALKFKEKLCIKGMFRGTITAEGSGDLFVEPGADVEGTNISVSSITIRGAVVSPINAADKIVICPGGKLKGDISARRLQIADKMLFEGQVNMAGEESEVEIFSRPTEDIKAELQGLFDKND
ncbi:MAG: polymer-forming cytoskeletal protein [Treponema sp.]|jgi:cytoskeletal protein CcmA (bactofilin family)|nr:polymer-forming cytoskeletal protein [Treponema sp.]